MLSKEKIKQTALELLRDVDVKETESIDIDATDYDDGSSSLTISVTYPEKGGGTDGQKDRD